MRGFLLDTHVFLWWLNAEPLLSEPAVQAIQDGTNEIFISAVSGWEIAVKRKLGKLKASRTLNAFVERAGFRHLPVIFEHGEKAGDLPMHHRDPFDRMLIAQALTDDFTIITRDAVFKKYKVRLLQA